MTSTKQAQPADFEPGLLASISHIVYGASEGKEYNISTGKGAQTFRAKQFNFKKGTPNSPLQYALWDITSSGTTQPSYRALCVSYRGTTLQQDWLVNADITDRPAGLDDDASIGKAPDTPTVASVTAVDVNSLQDPDASKGALVHASNYMKVAAMQSADASKVFSGLCMHQGFSKAVVDNKAADNIFAALKKYKDDNGLENVRLLITGHSLGGSLAKIFGLRVMAKKPELFANGGAVIVFGAPMVVCGDGAEAYKIVNDIYQDLLASSAAAGITFQTYVNNSDVVPRLLGGQNKNIWEPKEFKGLIQQALTYHPIGNYRLIRNGKVIGSPSQEDASAPMGSLAMQTGVEGNLKTLSTLPTGWWGWAQALMGSWKKGLHDHGIDLYCTWLGSSWTDPTAPVTSVTPQTVTVTDTLVSPDPVPAKKSGGKWGWLKGLGKALVH